MGLVTFDSVQTDWCEHADNREGENDQEITGTADAFAATPKGSRSGCKLPAWQASEPSTPVKDPPWNEHNLEEKEELKDEEEESVEEEGLEKRALEDEAPEEERASEGAAEEEEEEEEALAEEEDEDLEDSSSPALCLGSLM